MPQLFAKFRRTPPLPSREEFLSSLKKARHPQLPLDRFSIGFDNTHIDVFLSAQFCEQARHYLRHSLRHDVARHFWLQEMQEPGAWEQESFIRAYRGLMEAGIQQAASEGRPHNLLLLQTAVLRLLLDMLDEEMNYLRDHLWELRQQLAGDGSGRGLELYDRMVVFGRESAQIRHRALVRLFHLLNKLEKGPLRKLRKTLLGRSWTMSEAQTLNPLLRLPTLELDEAFMGFYPLLLGGNHGRGFLQVNRVVLELFRPWLPDWVREGADLTINGESSDLWRPQRFPEIGALLERAMTVEEFNGGRFSWLDVPDNLGSLLDSSDTRRRQLGASLLDRFEQALHREGLWEDMLAGYELGSLQQSLSRNLPPRLLYDSLRGQAQRREWPESVTEGMSRTELRTLNRTLERARKELRRTPRPQRRQHSAHFLRDFARLRRDLKLQYQLAKGMDSLRLVDPEEASDLARLNSRSLYSFQLPGERRTQQGPSIRSHAVIKADVRGSTRITAEMRRRGLNPASHFSLNLYQPINALLETFSARKLFVEGDAVIIGVFDFADEPARWPVLANACGLAARLLGLVQEKNLYNRRHGLPELELGIGIAYVDEPPTFVYDGDREVAISPAINRADELSSCDSGLRAAGMGEAVGGRPLQVVINGGGEKAALARYNVNGIELDAPGFHQLKSELRMRTLRLGPEDEEGVYHVARYPDARGTQHWLVIRDAPIQHWQNERLQGAEAKQRRFYEVVTDTAVINDLRAQAGSARRRRA